MEYRRRYGPMNPIHRNHEALTLIAHQLHRSQGGTMDYERMLVYTGKESGLQEAHEVSAAEIAAAFKALPADASSKVYKRS